MTATCDHCGEYTNICKCNEIALSIRLLRGLHILKYMDESVAQAKINPPANPPPPSSMPTNQGPRSIPSAHGGKPIPVVPSHAAIRQAQRLTMQTTSGTPYDYRTHMLVGRKTENDNSVMIARWPHLPSQAEIDQAVANSKGDYQQFALVAPVNFWDRK